MSIISSQDLRAAMELEGLLEESFHSVGGQFGRPIVTGIHYVGGDNSNAGGAHPVIKIEAGEDGHDVNGLNNNNNAAGYAPDIKIEPFDLDAGGAMPFVPFNGAVPAAPPRRTAEGNLTEEEFMKIEMPFSGDGQNMSTSLMIANLGLGEWGRKRFSVAFTGRKDDGLPRQGID